MPAYKKQKSQLIVDRKKKGTKMKKGKNKGSKMNPVTMNSVMK